MQEMKAGSLAEQEKWRQNSVSHLCRRSDDDSWTGKQTDSGGSYGEKNKAQ